MIPKIHFPLWILLTFFVIMGCASRGDIVQFKEDMVYLRGQVERLRDENNEIKEQLRSLSQSDATELDNVQRLRADLLSQIDALNQKSLFIDSKLEDVLNRVMMLTDEVEQQSARRFARDSLQTEGKEESVSGSSKELYDSAILDLRQGNHPLALQGFQELLRQYPESAYALSAQYLIGEIFYAKGEYDTAFLEFQKAVTEYPNGEKVGAALLKMGYCLLQQNDLEGAQRYLNAVIQQFPDTEEANLARAKLSGIQ